MKQLFHIHNEDTDAAAEKILSMRIGERHYSYAVTEKAGAELYSLGYFANEEMTGDVLSEIYSDHRELHNSFYEVQVSYDHPGSVLVPLQFYDAEAAKTVLNSMYGNIIGSSVISEPLNGWQLYNIYSVPNDVHDWVSRIYPSYKYRHNYTLAVGRLPVDPVDHILVDFTTDEFSFIVVKEGKLQIAQTLSYSSPEDILYHLLKACNQFSLSRGEIQLYISGLIEKESQLFRELYQYFLRTDFREPSWNLPVAKANGYPAHFFTSLNDLAQCAS
ncbi:MAG: DUF3822 family protein [Chitinophagales bacterium]